ncbi:MAG: hypothetical protein JWO22_515 [Frankiales bacterium]|nr:hypothetical protein [Frankiales bacterium]
MPPLDRLSQSIAGVATARSALLDAIGDVQAGARAIDATDALCAQGHGVRARTAHRSGAPAISGAQAAARNLPTLVANYRASLTALKKSDAAVTGSRRAALQKVVTDGMSEARAVADFQAVIRTAWVQYVSLDGLELVWIKRAVTPWYRTDEEGANAYAVLVGPGRRFVTVARTQLAAASRTVRGAVTAQAATLAAADNALSGLRTPTATPTLAG